MIGVISGFKHEYKAIEPQLKHLVPFFLDELIGDGDPMLKATVCWTLST